MTPTSTCPVCNGPERRLLAPGFWECTSLRTIETQVMVFDVGINTMRPATSVTRVFCGHRYHEADAAGDAVPAIAYCGCGVRSIGHCGDCGSAVCGFHGTVTDLLRCQGCQQLLLDHYQQEAAARERVEREAGHAMALQARAQAEARSKAVEAMPPATTDEVAGYIAEGRGQRDPEDWAMQTGKRIPHLSWAELATALHRRKLPTSVFGAWQPRRGLGKLFIGDRKFELWRGWIIHATFVSGGERWVITRFLRQDGEVVDRDGHSEAAGGTASPTVIGQMGRFVQLDMRARWPDL